MIKFKIPIGDWSGDGHGICEWYIAKAEGTLEDVREAYFKGCENLPKELIPENLFSKYQESACTLEIARKIYELSSIDFGINDSEESVYCLPETLAQYVVWVINRGNSLLNVLVEEDYPRFQFSGYDKGRHIGFFGYGLFSQ